jgi:transposase
MMPCAIISSGTTINRTTTPFERLQRYISLSRGNSLFCGSHAGAERTALIYSLACSCRLNGINTFEYFTDILNRLAYISPNAPDEIFQKLLPNRWTKK